MGMSENSRMKEITLWFEKGDDIIIARYECIVPMSSSTDLKMIGQEMGKKVAKVIKNRPQNGVKTLKMVVSWE